MYHLPARRARLLGCLFFGLSIPFAVVAADPPNLPPADAPASLQTELVPGLTLAALEQLALQGNPTLVQANSQIDEARGRMLQSGLYPNPTVGYNGEQMGQRSKAAPLGEQQGIFIDQTIVTGHKLQINRARYGQEVAQAELQSEAQRYRVINGLRVRFYQLLAMQKLLDVQAELLQVARDAVTTTEELVNVGAANKADLLQGRVEEEQERVSLENARALYQAAWQQLAAFVGNPCLGVVRLQGDLDDGPPLPCLEEALAHLLDASPEIQIARAEVTRSQFALKREKVEPIPNVQVRVTGGYDFEREVHAPTTTVNVGVRLPLYDKNQGNIRAAEAQLVRAQAEVCRVELSLRTRLSRMYARYRTAQALVESYRKKNLPYAKEAFELYLESFKKRRAAWPQVLVAQRTYFQISVDYVQALDELRRTEVAICGLLLVDGLDEPPGLPSEGPVRSREQESTGGNLPDPINSRQGRGLENRIGSGG